jgi:hypothetical protein
LKRDLLALLRQTIIESAFFWIENNQKFGNPNWPLNWVLKQNNEKKQNTPDDGLGVERRVSVERVAPGRRSRARHRAFAPRVA